MPITSSLLSAFVPQLATKLPAGTPMYVKVTPTVAPFLTAAPRTQRRAGRAGAGQPPDRPDRGRPGDRDLPWLPPGVSTPRWASTSTTTPPTGALAPTITPPPPSAIKARVLTNPVGTNEPAIEALFPNLFPTFAGALGDSFGAFPLPSFLGLDLNVMQVARQGNHFVLYANLDTAPQTRLENVNITDQSSGDSATDTAFDVNEWRHRSGPRSPPPRRRRLQGHARRRRLLHGRRREPAAPTPGTSIDLRRGARATARPGSIDLNHLIRGAHTIIDEHVALEWGGGESRFTTAVSAQAQVGSGGWQQFGFNANPSSVVDNKCWGFCGGSSGTKNVGFTGSGSQVLTGTTGPAHHGAARLRHVREVGLQRGRPGRRRRRGALRFGANDTIANGFTAGSYPGLGNRNLTRPTATSPPSP